MNKEQVELLGEYISVGKEVILLENIPDKVIEKGAIVIESDCSNKELTGYYENFQFKEPQWYIKLIESSKKHIPVLIIKDINKITEKEQRKFIELFKYRKIYVHKLPENCRILVTYSKLYNNPIDEDVYSYIVHI